MSAVWLGSLKIEEKAQAQVKATFGSAFKLLGTGFILMMVISIFLVVGIDVGFNSNSGQFLSKQFAMDPTAAESGRSVYFFGKMLGTFLGAILLTKLASRSFFRWTSLAALVSIIVLLLVSGELTAMVIVFIIGLTVANIFPIIFSITVEKYPLRANEISGLMIMAVSGGAAIPPLMGYLTDTAGVTAGMIILVICAVYLLLLSLFKPTEAKVSTGQ